MPPHTIPLLIFTKPSKKLAGPVKPGLGPRWPGERQFANLTLAAPSISPGAPGGESASESAWNITDVQWKFAGWK